MGSAEDALRRRRAAAQSQQKSAAQAQAESSRASRERLIRDVEALVPAALAGLERTGWPEGRLIKVRGRFRTREMAACPAGGYRFRPTLPVGEGQGRFNELLLLSDGRWAYGVTDVDPKSFGEIVRDMGDGKGPGSLRVSELPEGVEEALREYADRR
jgi:hypothetical protein